MTPDFTWGSLDGVLPIVLRKAVRRGERGLNNRPLDVVHNHDIRRPVIRYVGHSKKNPNEHLFICVQTSDPPRKKLTLVAFRAHTFMLESKAGRGGCSMRLCPGDAVQMSLSGRRQAFCAKCVQRVTGNAPCQWTQIELCRMKLKLGECRICEKFEEEI